MNILKYYFHSTIFRDVLIWISVVTIFAIVLSKVDYRARENDSRLYTKFLQQISQRPFSKIVEVHWVKSHYMDRTSPYVRDHLIGQFIVPYAMVKLGIDASNALYLFNTIIQIGWLYLLFYLVRLFTGSSHEDLLLWGMLLPPAWVYALRANHEQPLLFCTLLAIVAGVKLGDNWRWIGLVIVSVLWAFLIKGFGFMMVPIAFGTTFIINHFKMTTEFWSKLIISIVLVTLSLGLCAYGYEQWFYSLTGESFFEAYWRIQIVGRSLDGNTGFNVLGKLYNSYYYFSRILAYSAPWSLMFLGIVFWKRAEFALWWTSNSKLVLSFSIYIIINILIFSLIDRKASRYLFPAYFLAYALFASSVLFWKPKWRLSERTFFKNSKLSLHSYAAFLWLFLHCLSLFIYVARGGYRYWVK